jgi:hypothetical protein
MSIKERKGRKEAMKIDRGRDSERRMLSERRKIKRGGTNSICDPKSKSRIKRDIPEEER